MIVAFYNNKGGAGKSTLCAHAAFRAVEQKKTATLVDIDRQRNSMSWLSGHNWNGEFFENGTVRCTTDSAEMENGGLVLVDCPPSFTVVQELPNVDVWIIPVDGRFATDGSLNVIKELRASKSTARVVVVVNKALDSKFGRLEMEQFSQIPCELFRFPITVGDVVRKAEMTGVACWQVPYGIRSSTAQNLQMFADWVLSGCAP